MLSLRSKIAVVFCALMTAALPARAGPPRPHVLGTETISKGPVEILSVSVRPVRGGLLVSGWVERRFGYNYPEDSSLHIHVQVLDRHGRVLDEAETNYLPKPIPPPAHSFPRKAMYVVRLIDISAAATRIRVVCHGRKTAWAEANNPGGIVPCYR